MSQNWSELKCQAIVEIKTSHKTVKKIIKLKISHNCSEKSNCKKIFRKQALVQEQRQLQGRPPICEPGRQTQVISRIPQWYPQSFSDIISIWSQYISDPSSICLFFVKSNPEFRRSAPNQPSPWSNPIRQLDLTNWQTEHSATSTSTTYFFQVSKCKTERDFSTKKKDWKKE